MASTIIHALVFNCFLLSATHDLCACVVCASWFLTRIEPPAFLFPRFTSSERDSALAELSVPDVSVISQKCRPGPKARETEKKYSPGIIEAPSCMQHQLTKSPRGKIASRWPDVSRTTRAMDKSLCLRTVRFDTSRPPGVHGDKKRKNNRTGRVVLTSLS